MRERLDGVVLIHLDALITQPCNRSGTKSLRARPEISKRNLLGNKKDSLSYPATHCAAVFRVMRNRTHLLELGHDECQLIVLIAPVAFTVGEDAVKFCESSFVEQIIYCFSMPG